MTKQHKLNPTNSKPISLQPLTTDQSLTAALNVKKTEIQKLEKAEKAKKRKGCKKR